MANNDVIETLEITYGDEIPALYGKGAMGRNIARITLKQREERLPTTAPASIPLTQVSAVQEALDYTDDEFETVDYRQVLDDDYDIENICQENIGRCAAEIDHTWYGRYEITIVFRNVVRDFYDSLSSKERMLIDWGAIRSDAYVLAKDGTLQYAS